MAVNSGTIGFNDALYLHPSDTPGISLVQDPLIGIENYGVWSKAMFLALQAKNKLGFINVSSVRPAATHPTLHQWERCNAIFLSWLMSSVSKDIFSGIIYCNDASKVWADLKEKFDKICGACASARKYIDHEDQQRLIQFLMGLNDSYGQIRSHILMMTHLPSVNQAYSIVIHEESTRQALASQPIAEIPTAAFYSSSTKKHDLVKCENCQIQGHIKENFFRLIGYPPGHKLHKKFPQHKPMKFNQKYPKPYTNNSFNNSVESGPIDETQPTPVMPHTFTDAQYRQILKLLGDSSPMPEAATNFATSQA
ncbi:uncharacterized protein [Primulina eburnea]|uniref:uncharacterized protein n=1 Tax=Primulina eburnea TaxID=1245227 RepID=UPI003C6CA7CF